MMDIVRTLGASALLAGLLLAGCAVPQWQKPGTPLAQIEHALGTPTRTVALPGGGERLIYSYEPMGRQIYHMDFDANRQLTQVRQVATEADFSALRNGTDTRETVLDTFGPPAVVEQVMSFDGDIWTYRLMQENTMRLAHVHIDPQGVVQRVMFSDEILSDFDHGR